MFLSHFLPKNTYMHIHKYINTEWEEEKRKDKREDDKNNKLKHQKSTEEIWRRKKILMQI